MSGDVVTIVQAEVRLDDPHLTTDFRDRLGIRAALYDALVARTPDGSYSPALAESWTVSDDARTWRFNPRSGIRFHNGSELRASDIVASLERVLDPNRGGDLGTGGVIQSYLTGATVDAHSDGSVTLGLAEPMADLLDLLVDIPIVSMLSSETTSDLPVGTGRYRLDGEADGEVRAVRWDKYWGGPPAHAAIHWLREVDPAIRVDRLLAGTASLITNVPEELFDWVAASTDHQAVARPSTTAVGFICNAAQGVLTEPTVRRALNLAVDVDALIAATGRTGAVPLNGPLTHQSFGSDPELAPYRYDPAEAQMLLCGAGYGDGLALTLDVPERIPDEAPLLGQLLAEQFAKIGVETTIRSFSDRPAYAEMVRAKQIDNACCFDSTPISTFRVLREKLHGRVQGPWWQGYRNDSVDQLLDFAAATPDFAARRRLYQQAYRQIQADAPWIFLYSPRVTWGSARWSSGRQR